MFLKDALNFLCTFLTEDFFVNHIKKCVAINDPISFGFFRTYKSLRANQLVFVTSELENAFDRSLLLNFNAHKQQEYY